jgi:hypothetical protein
MLSLDPAFRLAMLSEVQNHKRRAAKLRSGAEASGKPWTPLMIFIATACSMRPGFCEARTYSSHPGASLARIEASHVP